MITKPITKTERNHNKQTFYAYASKGEIKNWRDAYAKMVFQRKPWYLTEKERLNDR